jgi:hypothetical protein
VSDGSWEPEDQAQRFTRVFRGRSDRLSRHPAGGGDRPRPGCRQASWRSPPRWTAPSGTSPGATRTFGRSSPTAGTVTAPAGAGAGREGPGGGRAAEGAVFGVFAAVAAAATPAAADAAMGRQLAVPGHQQEPVAPLVPDALLRQRRQRPPPGRPSPRPPGQDPRLTCPVSELWRRSNGRSAIAWPCREPHQDPAAGPAAGAGPLGVVGAEIAPVILAAASPRWSGRWVG